MGMPLNRALSMFGGMSNASLSQSREDMEEGKYVVLLHSLQNMESQKDFKPYMKIEGTILYPICDGNNRTPDMDMFFASAPGAPAEWVVFGGLYFHKEVAGILTKCLGISVEEFEEMKKSKSKEEFDKEFFEYCLEMTGEEIQGSETVRTRAGCFDNTTAVEIRVTKSLPKPKANPADNKPGTVYTNARVLRKVPLAEVAEKLEEADVIKYFGSVGHFSDLVVSEV